MPRLKEGDRVRVVQRPITEQDSKVFMYFPHMAGMTGVVENYYNSNEVAVKIDLESLPKVPSEIHKEATKRMRKKFVESVGEEQRKKLEKEELEFVPHYMALLREADLEKI